MSAAMTPNVQGTCAQLGCAYGWTSATVYGSLMTQVLSNAMYGVNHALACHLLL